MPAGCLIKAGNEISGVRLARTSLKCTQLKMFQAPRESLGELSVLHCNAVICLPQWTGAPVRGISPILPLSYRLGLKKRESRVPYPSVAELPWEAGVGKNV